MKNRKNATAAILAAAMAVTGTLLPASHIWAEGNQTTFQNDITEKLPAMPSDMTEEEIEKAAMAADGAEIIDLPEKDGDYLIYMEPEAAETTLIQNEVQEIAAEAPEIIVEADLSAAEARELEAQSRQSEEIYIEENIYLDGASIEKFPTEAPDTNAIADDSDSTDASSEDDISFLNNMDALERHNWKKTCWTSKWQRRKKSSGIYRWCTQTTGEKKTQAPR